MTLPVDLARDVGHDLCRKLEEVLGGEEKELRRREVCPGRPREDEALREPKKEDGARGGERQRREARWPRRRAPAGEEGKRKRIEEELTRVRLLRKGKPDLYRARLAVQSPSEGTSHRHVADDHGRQPDSKARRLRRTAGGVVRREAGRSRAKASDRAVSGPRQRHGLASVARHGAGRGQNRAGQ